MPAAIRRGRNALQLYGAGSDYRAALATPFDVGGVEFNLAHLPERFSLGFSESAPRSFDAQGTPALVIDFIIGDPTRDVRVYEEIVALRNLHLLEGGYEGNPAKLLGREFYPLQRLTATEDKPRERTMNALYAEAREAMRAWVQQRGLPVPRLSYDESGRIVCASPEASTVSWLEPRDEPMDAITAYQAVGCLRGFPRSVPDVIGERLDALCAWRTDHHPRDAYSSKDSYNRRNEERDWKRALRRVA